MKHSRQLSHGDSSLTGIRYIPFPSMHAYVCAHTPTATYTHTKSDFYHGAKINFKKNSSHGAILMDTTLMSFLQIVWS